MVVTVLNSMRQEYPTPLYYKNALFFLTKAAKKFRIKFIVIHFAATT